MKPLAAVLILLVGLGAGWAVATWDSTPPEVLWIDPPEIVGPKTELQVEIRDQGRGLKSLRLRLRQQGRELVVHEENFDEAGFLWTDGTLERRLELRPSDLAPREELKEGSFTLETQVQDHASLGLWSRETIDEQTFHLDRTPPRIEVLSNQHYIRQGGSAAVRYRLSEPVHSSGIQVGDRIYGGYPVPSKEEGVYICLFALGHDQDRETPMTVWAQDAAGNRGRENFWKKVFPGRFRKRNLNISDRFMERVLPRITERSDQVRATSDSLETFLEVNGSLRRVNNRQIAEMAAQSAATPLWTEEFLQLSNSQVESSFADFRSYFYRGKMVDEQTHLGFDLASLAQAPVECSNDGVVIYADYLGIYGNTVVVDHGLGLQSLYAHLSRFDVEVGEEVRKRQSLGRTGQTGLAGGDHLHFTMVLHGTQVNPIEWWDPAWVRKRVLSRLDPRNGDSRN